MFESMLVVVIKRMIVMVICDGRVMSMGEELLIVMLSVVEKTIDGGERVDFCGTQRTAVLMV